jgi:sugar/nucleoside kinase (ribokinase family)
MKRVLVVGGVSWDRIVQLDRLPSGVAQTVFSSSTRDMVGSTGAGKALSLSSLGFKVVLHAQVGDDEPGTKIREYFLNRPIETQFYLDPRGSETHINLMDKNGGRVSIYTSYVTFEPQMDLKELAERVGSCDIIVLNIMNYARKLIPFAKNAGKSIWCDIHDFDGQDPYHGDFIEAADYLFASSERLPDPEAFMIEQIRLGKKLVVCTSGKNGAKAITMYGERCEVGIVDAYPVVDTNGAGDAFFAGFLFGHVRNFDLTGCMKLGSIAGGLCVSSQGLVNPDMTEELLISEFKVRNLTSSST